MVRGTHKLGAIKFLTHWQIGFDVLVTEGSVSACPGHVYICNTQRLRTDFKELEAHNVEFLVRFDIRPLMTVEELRTLADKEGWIALPPPLPRQLLSRIRKQFGWGKIIVADREQLVFPPCRDCGKGGRYICNKGAFTRVYGIYLCPDGHLFTYG